MKTLRKKLFCLEHASRAKNSNNMMNTLNKTLIFKRIAERNGIWEDQKCIKYSFKMLMPEKMYARCKDFEKYTRHEKKSFAIIDLGCIRS